MGAKIETPNRPSGPRVVQNSNSPPLRSRLLRSLFPFLISLYILVAPGLTFGVLLVSCKINDLPPDSANTLLKKGCPHLPASKGVGDRPDVTMGPEIDQVALKGTKKT